MKRTALIAGIVFIATLSVALYSLVGLSRGATEKRTDRALYLAESASVRKAADLMARRGLTSEARLALQLLLSGIWRAATPEDGYLATSERQGNTPYAYTLSSGKHPSAIVLAPRFFTETSPTARAALLIHEMGHYQAYVRTGHSDEYDGYKPEYDTHIRLGLGETDSLPYFSMLDGVVEYVVPRDKSYKTKAEVQAYITQSGS